MYGAKQSSAAVAAGSTATISHGWLGQVWWLFAAVTLVFAAVAMVQLVRRPARHRP